MKLRKLEMTDAPRMLEWMHDEEVLKGLQAAVFRNKTIDDCKCFIEKAQDMTKDCHMAIVDDEGLYQGTVSVKEIDHEYKDAEFSIVLRRDAWGKGYATYAMREIIRISFEEYDLDEVYWNVLASNHRAIDMYMRLGYQELKEVDDRRRDRGPRNANGQLEEVRFYRAVNNINQ